MKVPTCESGCGCVGVCEQLEKICILMIELAILCAILRRTLRRQIDNKRRGANEESTLGVKAITNKLDREFRVTLE